MTINDIWYLGHVVYQISGKLDKDENVLALSSHGNLSCQFAFKGKEISRRRNGYWYHCVIVSEHKFRFCE